MMRMLVPLFVLFFLFTLVPDSSAQTGTVQGSVQITASQKTLSTRSRGNAYRSRYQAKKTPTENQQTNPLEDVVVFLTPIDQQVKPEPLSNPSSLTQKDVSFSPRVIPVTVGSTISIVNQDRIYHNVFSKSPVKSFNIGKRLTGETVYQTFDKPGVVQVFCNIHTNMSAYILVLNTPFFQRLTPQATFRFENLPAGRYKLEVFHPDYAMDPVEITVESGSSKTFPLVLS